MVGPFILSSSETKKRKQTQKSKVRFIPLLVTWYARQSLLMRKDGSVHVVVLSFKFWRGSIILLI